MATRLGTTFIHFHLCNSNVAISIIVIIQHHNHNNSFSRSFSFIYPPFISALTLPSPSKVVTTRRMCFSFRLSLLGSFLFKFGCECVWCVYVWASSVCRVWLLFIVDLLFVHIFFLFFLSFASAFICRLNEELRWQKNANVNSICDINARQWIRSPSKNRKSVKLQ